MNPKNKQAIWAVLGFIIAFMQLVIYSNAFEIIKSFPASISLQNILYLIGANFVFFIHIWIVIDWITPSINQKEKVKK